jgi:citrate synthase
MSDNSDWMIAAEAAKRLRIHRATLYAYVSRGLIRSEALPGRERERRYSREDVERLRRRNGERRDPQKAGRTLQWGVPILESAITLIADGKLYYRGRDASGLARTASLESVAALIWSGSAESDVSDTPLHVISGAHSSAELPFIARAQCVLAMVAERDPLAYDLRPRSVASTGWRILNLLTSVAAETAELEETVDQTLAASWAGGRPPADELIRAALILSADYDLNVSAFTARCIASAGSNPYAVVIGGLTAMEGSKHGGAAVRVKNLFEDLRRRRDLRRALSDRLRSGEAVEGFGEELYPGGDPRAATLLAMLRKRFGKSAELAFAESLATAGQSLTGEKPTFDFALAALCRVLRLPPGTPLTLLAIGRAIGWIGHAIEQYALDGMIRPRAIYVGLPPTIASSE